MLSFGCGDKKESPKQAANVPLAPLKVQGYVIKSKKLNQSFNIPGTLLANELTELRPEVSGRVTGILFKEGSSVNKGDLLVKMFDGDLQAQLQKLQVQLQIAKKNEQRQKELLSINGVSQQDYELAQLQMSNISADIDIIKSSIEKTEIRAPFRGKIGLRNISQGAYVTPATVVTTIVEARF